MCEQGGGHGEERVDDGDGAVARLICHIGVFSVGVIAMLIWESEAANCDQGGVVGEEVSMMETVLLL